MRHESEFDHLRAQAVEAADEERLVPDPEREAKQKNGDAVRRELTQAKEAHAGLVQDGKETSQTEGRSPRRRIRSQEGRSKRLTRQREALPSPVPIQEVQNLATVFQLGQERKPLVNLVKLVASWPKTELANPVEPFLGWHHENEVRAFLRGLYRCHGGGECGGFSRARAAASFVLTGIRIAPEPLEEPVSEAHSGSNARGSQRSDGESAFRRFTREASVDEGDLLAANLKLG